MSDSEWYGANCPACKQPARWLATRNDGGPLQHRIRCPRCGDSGEEAAAVAAVLKGDAA